MIKNASGMGLACSLTVLGVMACAERLRPRRARVAPSGPRWTANLAMVLVGGVLTRLLLPATLVGAAIWAEIHRVGPLNRTLWPLWLKLVLGVVWLDLVIYWQHRLFHRVAWLWRVHSVHHTDLDLDAASGVRFHPLEFILSAIVKMAAIAVFGVHFLGVTLFKIILNASSFFNHSNVAIPPVLDAALRLIIVTPDMHRIHHTVETEEQNSNFGFCLPWWDHLFGTYRPRPRGEHPNLELGLKNERDPAKLGLMDLLLMPFRKSS